MNTDKNLCQSVFIRVQNLNKLNQKTIFTLLALVVLLVIACTKPVETAVLIPHPQSGIEAAPVPDLSAYPWFYLRDGQPLTNNEPVVELIAVGDVMLGRDVILESEPLADAAAWLAAADLTFGNLEAVIVEEGTPRTAPPDGPQPIILQAPVTAVSHLTAAGFDILSLANNHSLDFGPEGLAETAVHLQNANITPIGAGPDVESAYQPLIREVNGLRLAFLAFNAVPDPVRSADFSQPPAQAGTTNPVRSANFSQPPAQAGTTNQWQRADWDEARAVAAVTQAREQADAVIVSMHWGYEYELQADPWQETAVQTLFAAGADLVLGHHPHVVQDLTGFPETCQVSGCFAAYSLGNFVFDQGQDETDQGLALRIFFDSQGLRAVQALPIWAGPRPRLMTPEEASPLLARIQPPPPRIGFACEGDNCRPVEESDFDKLSQREAVSGFFWSGTIDLTGDGVDEVIRRTGERVTIYQKTTCAEENVTPSPLHPCTPSLSEVYATPPEWRVVDAALGDPNDDGRFELLLAIWQTDNEGHERSQPYIVGYRGGEYQLIWGGRPLARPVSEVELGDVDGDGKQELISVEADAIAVWCWQGWNFSLMWRSENGRYQDLILVEENGRLQVSVTQNYP
jgi:poly-gamma-glutamate synthesis protein (capsule biosynthesis protein)